MPVELDPSLDSVRCNPSPGQCPPSSSLVLLLDPAPNLSRLLPLRHRPHQSQLVSDSPILRSAPSHLSTNTIAGPCPQLRRNPTVLVQPSPVDQQVRDPPASWTATLWILLHQEPYHHPTLPPLHPPCSQPFPQNSNRLHRPRHSTHQLEEQMP